MRPWASAVRVPSSTGVECIQISTTSKGLKPTPVMGMLAPTTRVSAGMVTRSLGGPTTDTGVFVTVAGSAVGVGVGVALGVGDGDGDVVSAGSTVSVLLLPNDFVKNPVAEPVT